jgi:hypothetical protein
LLLVAARVRSAHVLNLPLVLVCIFDNFLHFLRRVIFAAPLHFLFSGGHARRRQFDYLRPESNKTRILYYGAGRAESGIMVYGGVFRSISNHKMYLGRITEANECADGGAARQLLYFYALKSVPLAPISHYQSYECKICRVLCVTCVFV